VTSFDVQFWQIETRKDRKPRVRWIVAGNKFGESFATKGLAEAYRAKLITAARNGEAFSTDTGLPMSMERKLRNITFYQHALEFSAATWPAAAARTRSTITENLAFAIPLLTKDLPGAPDPEIRIPTVEFRCRVPVGEVAGYPSPSHSSTPSRSRAHSGPVAGGRPRRYSPARYSCMAAADCWPA